MTDQVLQVARFVFVSARDILPVFFLSLSLGVLVRALRLDGAVRRALGSRPGRAIVLATAVGAFSPFCSCNVVPVVASLLIGGVPLAPVMAFWIASPTMDPEIFALSVGLLGWPLAVARLLAALSLSLGAGYLTLVLTSRGLLGPVLRREVAEEARGPALAHRNGETECCSPAKAAVQPALVAVGAKGSSSVQPATPPATTPAAVVAGPRQLSWRGFARSVAREAWRLGRWLLVAFALEALMLAYIPHKAIARTLGSSNPLAVPLAALIGAPLYMTEVAALPIVSGLLEGGMSPGAALAFLISGPATTVPAVAAVWRLVRPRVLALYVGVSVVGAALLGLVTEVIL
jgi:uncharacterized membrane protein YraQ (UPF0718 family)